MLAAWLVLVLGTLSGGAVNWVVDEVIGGMATNICEPACWPESVKVARIYQCYCETKRVTP
jgi:hypothetical protein